LLFIFCSGVKVVHVVSHDTHWVEKEGAIDKRLL